MKYRHKKSQLVVFYKSLHEQYVDEGCNVYLNKDMVEDSNDWQRIIETPEEVKTLQSIPCLSINDVGKVYVTANRNNPKIIL